MADNKNATAKNIGIGMRWHEAVNYMRSNPEKCLEKAENGGYICPCCGSGSGKHKSGMQKSRIPNRFSCFSTKNYADGCYRAADIIQILAIADNIVHSYDEIKNAPIEIWNEAVINAAENHFGIQINEMDLKYRRGEIEHPMHSPRPMNRKPTYIRKPAEEPLSPEEIYANSVIPHDIEESQNYQDPSDYLLKRGLSKRTQEHFHCGFLPCWVSPKLRYKKEHEGKKVYGSPRVIIPTGPCSYLARDIRDSDHISEKARAYTKMKAGSHAEFNWCITKSKDHIFVTEGEIDAMSIYEAGQRNVLALGSAAYVSNFMDYIKKNSIKEKTFYVVLDKDKAGRKASESFIQRLKESGNLGIDASSIILEGTKDANESLVKNRNRFVVGLAKKVLMLQTIAKRASAKGR